jgi:hypothetical protein
VSKLGQQWHAFQAWSDTILLEERGSSTFVPKQAGEVMLDKLAVHHRPRVGRVCPRCSGEVVQSHPRDRDPACLQCGFEPIVRPPQTYVFEPYQDHQAESRHDREWTTKNSDVTVRVAFDPKVELPDGVCFKCGHPWPDEQLKVRRCPDCYREYCAQLRFGVYGR